MEHVFTLRWPPSANHYWRHARGRHYISAEGQAYRSEVVWIVKARRIVPMSGRLFVGIVASPPDNRARDLDNIQKCLFDALQHGGLYGSDSQIDKIVIERSTERTGTVVVTVRQHITASNHGDLNLYE